MSEKIIYVITKITLNAEGFMEEEAIAYTENVEVTHPINIAYDESFGQWSAGHLEKLYLGQASYADFFTTTTEVTNARTIVTSMEEVKGLKEITKKTKI